MNVLAVLDPETHQITLINISRDSMVEMEVMDELGNSVGTAKAQLALSYSYGDGGDVSCRLTRDAVSGQTQGQPRLPRRVMPMLPPPVLHEVD